VIDSLPTPEQLEKLPLRAVVSYAARNALRLSSKLRGIVANKVVNQLLHLVKEVSTTDLICEVDKALVIRAAEQLASAYADAPDKSKSIETFRVVFSLGHAAQAALFAILAITEPMVASDYRKLASEEAHYVVRPIGVFRKRDAKVLMAAAIHDYNTLLRAYGEHTDVVEGMPVTCFD
jgi:hypothetical protein